MKLFSPTNLVLLLIQCRFIIYLHVIHTFNADMVSQKVFVSKYFLVMFLEFPSFQNQGKREMKYKGEILAKDCLI